MLYLLLLQGRPLLNPSTLTCHLVAAEYEGVKEETWSSKDMLQVSKAVRAHWSAEVLVPLLAHRSKYARTQPLTAAFNHQTKGRMLLTWAGLLSVLSSEAEVQTAPLMAHLTGS